MRKVLAVFVSLIVIAGTAGSATAAPCGEHKGKAKQECKAARAKATWPPNPTPAEIKSRIGTDQWRKAERIAVCETGANWQHYPNGSYIGGLGMFRTTYAVGQRVTRYRWPAQGATKAEQIAVAFASHSATRGWSGWGCGSA